MGHRVTVISALDGRPSSRAFATAALADAAYDGAISQPQFILFAVQLANQAPVRHFTNPQMQRMTVNYEAA